MLAGNVALLRADEQPKWYTDAAVIQGKKKKNKTKNDALLEFKRRWNILNLLLRLYCKFAVKRHGGRKAGHPPLQ